MWTRRAQIIRFQESFWIVPGLIAAASVVFALLSTSLDAALSLEGLGTEPLGYTGGPEAASSFLITIAGSIITVAGTSFSITIAVLALTSVQFGPRLIRNFVRDVSNQVVLGVFLATFLYCMVVLRTIRGPDEGEFVPYFSLAIASLMGLISVGFLIYFISHVARSIQVMNVIASIGRDLDTAIVALFPEEQEHSGGPSPSPYLDQEMDERTALRPVASRRSGYIRSVDFTRLVETARIHRLRIRVPHHAGQFVPRGSALAEVVHDDGSWPDIPGVGDAICAAFEIGDDRVSDQDIEFYIDQLVEIGVRALSAAINDPFTAIACIDRLGSSMRLLVRRELPSPYHADSDGILRVVAKTQTVQGALDAAFNLIRQYGRTTPTVSMRLIETMAVIAEHTSDPAETAALLSHARMVEHGARMSLEEEADIMALEERFARAIRAIEAPDSESL